MGIRNLRGTRDPEIVPSICPFCFSLCICTFLFVYFLLLFAHGKVWCSVAFNYSNNWTRTDDLWIPFFKLLERIWRTQLESCMRFLVVSQLPGAHICGFVLERRHSSETRGVVVSKERCWMASTTYYISLIGLE